ncbi:hypothetical protein AVEN_11700-1 [Araneus ventricosus]|uniref:PiggyBac transposable element-derived protein domain-containing protein n=1 Tax=Araneus ventricosus TaxID=182803 RepID=A0A4Y2RTX3_ARAVE|nr:hypothetical protein AVEN_94021-1 [Araneus ventricosus]GBN79324.1 hypothetical protein AVEN_11700-1 [Araneus ventricosus]
MRNDNAIDSSTGESKKPKIITFYNMTKGGVDVVNEMAASYSTSRKTKRWPKVIFFSLLNVAAINARIILLSTKTPPSQNQSRRAFLKHLGLQLIEDYRENRSHQAMLPQSIKEKLKPGKEMEPPNKKAKTVYKRCAK